MIIILGSNSTTFNFNLLKHPGLYLAAKVDGKGWHRAKLLKFTEVRVFNLNFSNNPCMLHKWQEHGVREKKCFTVDLF